MIKDQQNRVHDYLRISLTERCNLRCFYCMPEGGVELAPKSHLMTYEEILAIATTFVKMGVKKIRLTGGEPLIRKDANVIIEALGQLPIELAITTNGIIVDRFISSFKKAGLKAVNVSLDTLDRDKFALVTKRDDFEKVRKNIDLLLAEGFFVKINVVLMRAINFDEIIDFINVTEHKNLQIQFIEFMPFDGNKWDWEKGISLAEIIEQANTHYQESNVLRIQDKPNDTAVNYKIKGYKGSFSVISTITNPFCSTCNRIRLTANGRIKNCLFSTGETDLLTPFRAGEDIEAIILKSIQSKAPERGGWESLEEFSKPENHGQNRSMILIGG
jgi:molybdenum cofactor biosynthesis protein A